MKKISFCEKGTAVKNIVLFAGIVLFLGWSPLLMGAEPDIGLLVSQNTYAYFENAYEPKYCTDGTLGTNEYDRYYLGWEWVLEYAGIQYTVLTDEKITPDNLKNLRVLILSNNFWLDDAQTKTIAEWVRRGGHLLATYGTGYAGTDGRFLKGGTNGLHELWGDPSAKLNSSYYYGNPWVKVQITQNGGPTGGFDAGDVLDYEYMANILIKRPASNRDINAFFLFNDEASGRPAIFNNRHSKGLVVYYAFAPEYLISLASDWAGHCENDTRYSDVAWKTAIDNIANRLKDLMISTLNYLLAQ